MSEADEESKKHTPESVMIKLEKCETEVGKQIEALRLELDDHQDIVAKMHADWEQFLVDFKELFIIFKSVKGFFKVLGWFEKGIKWVAMLGIAIGTVVVGIKSGIWK